MGIVTIYKGNINVLYARVILKDNKAVIEERTTIKKENAEFYIFANIFLTLKTGDKTESLEEAKRQYLTDIEKLDLDQLEKELSSIETEEQQKAFDNKIRRRTANYYYDAKTLKPDRTISKKEFKTLKIQYRRQNKKQNAPQQK